MTGTENESFTTKQKIAIGWQLSIFIVAAVVGTLSILGYATTAPPQLRLNMIGTLALVGGAAVVTGAFFGFLFGVPRTREGLDSAAVTTPTVTPDDVTLPNTNLEHISDWLTKILVGITLGQLGNIGPGAGRLFRTISDSLNAGRSGTVFVGALVVYGAAVGFIYGWLTARVWVAWLINTLPIRSAHAVTTRQYRRASRSAARVAGHRPTARRAR